MKRTYPATAEAKAFNEALYTKIAMFMTQHGPVEPTLPEDTPRIA